jgi:peptidoglycan/xylan/chitin deacetylase (PgdA/CDA1 family)
LIPHIGTAAITLGILGCVVLLVFSQPISILAFGSTDRVWAIALLAVAWSQRGIEFGGHTASHRDLRNISEDEVEREIAQCRNDLEALLGGAPASFAYPFGGFDGRAHAAARNNFKMAFTTKQGLLDLGSDPHLIPRTSWPSHAGRIVTWCCLNLGVNPWEACRVLRFIVLEKLRTRSVTTANI